MFVPGHIDSRRYQDTLAKHLLPVGPLITSGAWIFQQDNAPIHRSEATNSWFEANEVTVLRWPSRSPDLNPIENLWGWLVRRVYAEGRQFAGVPQLQEAILRAWAELPPTILHQHVDSMPTRMKEVIYKKGGVTKY